MLDFEGRETSLTSSEVLVASTMWATTFAHQGLSAGDRIIICLDHGPDLYMAYLGALLIGAVPSFAAAASPKQSAAAVEKALERLIAEAAPRTIVAESRQTIGNLGRTIRLSPTSINETANIQDFWSDPTQLRSPEDTLFVQYSSGTTGAKKGVSITGQMLEWQIDRYVEAITLTPNNKIVSRLPLYHDMGLITAFFLPLMTGVPLIAISPFDWVKTPWLLLHAIEKHRATLCWLPNFAFDFLAKHTDTKQSQDLSSIRMLINCSEPIQASSHDKFLSRFRSSGVQPETISSCYAMAETTFAITGSRPGATLTTAPYRGKDIPSSGAPLNGAEVRIVDSERGNVLEGDLGQIQVCMPSLFTGYVRGSEIDRESIVDGWHQTGDIGFLRNGELFVLGREDDTIIVAGQNIFPQDIESAINDVQGVIPGRNVAFGVFDKTLGTESLVVLAESAESSGPQADAIQRTIAAAIGSEIGLAPADVRILPHMWLEKSTSGKISRKIKRQRYLTELKTAASPNQASQIQADPYDPNATVRMAVLKVLAGKIGAPTTLSDSESLFEYGLIDSLSFIDLILELERCFARPAPVKLIENPREHANVAAIATLFADQEGIKAETKSHTIIKARDLRRQLVPHIVDTDATPMRPHPYLMTVPQPNYKSPTANTDEHGFRVTRKFRRNTALREVRSMPIAKGVVLGNSQAWGTGARHDDDVIHNVLNSEGPEEMWVSVALRDSNLTQERLAAELYAPLDARHYVWITGAMTLGLMLETFSHSMILPFRNMSRFMKLVGMPNGLIHKTADPERRLTQALSLADRELVLFQRIFSHANANLMFVLQPSITGTGKQLSPEEQDLTDRFALEGKPVALDPTKILSVRERFVSRLKDVCNLLGIKFVDVGRCPEFQSSSWLFVDHLHLTSEGHRALANVINRHLT